MSRNFRSWPILLALRLASAPLVLMYVYLVVDTVTDTAPGALLPQRFTLEHWRFLWQDMPSRPSIWLVTLNTLIFATVTSAIVLVVSSLAGYALSRLNVPGRGGLLAGTIVLHAFPSVTLLIAIFLILQLVGLYNTLGGVILVKTALELPFGIWIMKGFNDTVPWEIEMAGIVDGASRAQIFRRVVLPQVRPALLALGIFSFLAGWSEFILAPGQSVQMLSVYLASLIQDDSNFDMNLFKAVGVFYAIPVILMFVFFQNRLLAMYGGGTKG